MNIFIDMSRYRTIALTAVVYSVLIIGIIVYRVAGYDAPSSHHHANFALYVNDVRDEFKSFTFYEEVQACTGNHDNPKAKAHMHDQKNHLVHVHAAEEATWGLFFRNLGYELGDNFIKTDAGTFPGEGTAGKLHLLLNGELIDDIAERPIRSEDVLLVDFGSADQSALLQRYAAIPRDAAEANTQDDPATCRGSEKPTLTDKLKAALDLP